MVPITFEPWFIIIAFVFFLIDFFISFIFKYPKELTGIIVVSILNFFNEYNGRKTELCSIIVVIAWSPGFKTPFIAIFNESVAFDVNIMFRGFSIFNNIESLSLQSNILLSHLIDKLWAPLPGLAQ